MSGVEGREDRNMGIREQRKTSRVGRNMNASLRDHSPPSPQHTLPPPSPQPV